MGNVYSLIIERTEHGITIQWYPNLLLPVAQVISKYISLIKNSWVHHDRDTQSSCREVYLNIYICLKSAGQGCIMHSQGGHFWSDNYAWYSIRWKCNLPSVGADNILTNNTINFISTCFISNLITESVLCLCSNYIWTDLLEPKFHDARVYRLSN